MKKIIKRGRRPFSSGGEGGDERIFFFFSFSCFFLRTTKIELQVFIRTEGEIDLLDESYTWTPKSWSFDKLREVGVLSYLKLHFV